MARALADPVLGRTFDTGEQTLARLRGAGANIAESTLSLYVAGMMNRTPESIWDQVKAGDKTWGELLNTLGIKVDTVGDVIEEKVKTRK